MLAIQLFGGFQLTLNGEYISGLTRPRGKSLLAYLILHHETPQERAHLAYTFWPESSDKQARTNLRRELHYVRQCHPLFNDSLISDIHSIQWIMPRDSTLDTQEFSRLVQASANQIPSDAESLLRIQNLKKAIELYQGEFLSGLYDNWIIVEREKRQQQFIQALEVLTQLLTANRNYGAAIMATQRLLQHDPLYEVGYLHLMELYACQNDRARALHTYHTCTSILERELGVPPSRDMEEAYQRLLRAEDRLAKHSILPLASLSRLVGRKLEWQLLLSKWKASINGHPLMVLISGEAGIGKSRLAEELLEWGNRQGVVTAQTRSYAAEGSLAYAPVIEWLRSDALTAVINSVDHVWLTELARLLPELLIKNPRLPLPEPMTEERQRQRLFEALARVFTATSQPTLLLIDDLQWCDQATLEWLRFLLRFDATASIFILGTVRSEEVDDDHPLRSLITELQSQTQLTQIELEPLTANETVELAIQEKGRSLDETVLERVFQESEGNPLFVVEMVRAGYFSSVTPKDASLGMAELPPKVYAVIQHRLAQLSPVARSLVSLAATIGRAFSYELLFVASSCNEDEVVGGLDELWRRRIIREQKTGEYDFGHDRIREAAYAELSPIRKKSLHGAIAEALETVYQESLDAVSGKLAYHFARAGLHKEAVRWYRRAGEVAHKLCSYLDSVDYLKRALHHFEELPPKGKSVEQRIEILILQRKNLTALYGFAAPEVETICRQVEFDMDHELSLELRFEVIELLRAFYGAGNDLQKAFTYSHLQLELADKIDDPVRYVGAYQSVALTSIQFGNYEDARNLLSIAARRLAMHEQLIEEEPSLFVRILAKWAFVLWLQGYPDQARQKAEQGLEYAIHGIIGAGKHVAFFLLSLYYRSACNVDVLSQLANHQEKVYQEYDVPYAHFAADGSKGYVLVANGNFDEGIRLLRRNIDGYTSTRHTMLQPFRLGSLLEAQLRAGRLHDGLETAEEAFAMSKDSGQPLWDAELNRLHGELLWELGESEAHVEECFQNAIAIAEKQSAKMLRLRASVSLCRLWKRQGKFEEARQLLQEIYDWFSEGFDTPDLIEAKALLNSLSS